MTKHVFIILLSISRYVRLPNWSHTGLYLTSSIRLDLVWIGQVMSDYLTSQYTTSPFRLRLVRLAWVKEHKEMESVRDPNVALPDCRQVWEAPSQYLFYCWTLNPPSFPQPGGSRRYFRWLSNQSNPLVGWYLTIVLVEARWFTRIQFIVILIGTARIM